MGAPGLPIHADGAVEPAIPRRFNLSPTGDALY